ncbi:NPCBM/NEW2 domain-containing protein [Lentibacillus saliphilus]|uniref:NPCBM/NEW2 domain-containing protein n=1 Tax=Lentibacillus saliphilus TaxID=2737028 RepID=UPI001C3110F7|nr:NPCBM/NEW2 domain-containing protein [Lentibacillus saliphilus]
MRNWVVLVIVSLLLFITACSSSNGAFHDQIKQANQLMNDMKYEDAIKVFADIEENMLPGDTYEAGRMDLIEGLKSEAQYMVEHIDELKEDYEDSMALVKDVKASKTKDIDLYSEAMYQLDYTIDRFNDLTQLDMYEDLTKAREEIVSEIEKWVSTLQSGVDSGLESDDFARVESQLDDMAYLNQAFPEQMTDEIFTQYEEKVTEARERFVFVPEQVYQWNEVIHENEDGSIQIEGITDADGEGIELVISFQGYYHKLSEKIDLSPELILTNGDVLYGSSQEVRVLDDQAVKTYMFSAWEEYGIDDIVRFNVNLPFVQEDAIKVAFDGVDQEKMYEIPGIESIKALHQPEWTIQDDAFEVVIDRFFVDNYNLEITGVIKPTQDVVVNDLSRAYLPFTKESSTIGLSFLGTNQTELYAGTEKEFEINHSFNRPITEYHDYIDLHLYHHNVLVDLQDGKIFKQDEPTFIEDLDKEARYLEMSFDESNQEELITQSGNRAAVDSIMLSGSLKNTYELDKRFNTFKTTVHVHNAYSGVDYGTTELKIYSVGEEDDKELYTTTISEDHKAKDIEIDVKGVKTLKITTSQDRGSEGRQHIILEEPVVQ